MRKDLIATLVASGKKMSFGPFIRRLRLINKLNLAVAAEKVGCAVSYIPFLEKGQRKPSKAMLTRIAKAYGVEEECLLEKVGTLRTYGTLTEVLEDFDGMGNSYIEIVKNKKKEFDEKALSKK